MGKRGSFNSNVYIIKLDVHCKCKHSKLSEAEPPNHTPQTVRPDSPHCAACLSRFHLPHQTSTPLCTIGFSWLSFPPHSACLSLNLIWEGDTEPSQPHTIHNRSPSPQASLSLYSHPDLVITPTTLSPSHLRLFQPDQPVSLPSLPSHTPTFLPLPPGV